METRDQTFTLRFTLQTAIPDECWADDDFEENAWLDEWEREIKPGLIRDVFAHLRDFERWQAHVRNRGLAPEDEIEIVLVYRHADGDGGSEGV